MIMTQGKKKGNRKLQGLTLLPIIIVMFFSVSMVNAENVKIQSTKSILLYFTASKINVNFSDDTIKKALTAVSLVKMNVLYIGVDNPVTIAVSGIDSKDILAEISNGTLSGQNGEYIARVKTTGVSKIFVYVVDKKGTKTLVSEKNFRVKSVPDPVAMVGFTKEGEISKEKLLKEGKLEVVLQNFDFDLHFSVISFTISIIKNGFNISQSSSSEKFTAAQIELINKVDIGSKIYFEDIRAIGPDGTTRTLSSIVFKIVN
jgi:gliding motility-associated protein GldM